MYTYMYMYKNAQRLFVLKVWRDLNFDLILMQNVAYIRTLMPSVTDMIFRNERCFVFLSV